MPTNCIRELRVLIQNYIFIVVFITFFFLYPLSVLVSFVLLDFFFIFGSYCYIYFIFLNFRTKLR